MKNYLPGLHWPVFAVLAGTAAGLLVLRPVDNIGFYSLLLLAAIAGVFRLRPGGYRFGTLLKEYWPLHLAMAGMVLAIFLNQLVLQNFVIKTYDYPSRMFFFAVLLWVALLLPHAWMKQLQWAYIVGALAAAAHLYVTTQGGTFRGYVYFMPIIELGQMSQLLGFFALLTIGYGAGNGVWQRIGIVLKLAAGAAGIYAAYLSQTRGAWLGIPVFVLIAALVLRQRFPLRRMLAMVATLLVAMAVLFASSDLVQERMDEAQNDLAQYYLKDNPVTSVGVRLQLWAGSWLLFLEHPAVGVGREGYSKAMLELEQRGILTPQASHQPHSHNEILYNMVTLGVPGLVAILALYLVPAAYFLRAARHADREIRVTGGMGLILCSGFLILGLTDVMFMWGACDNFYAIFAAILFAFIIRRKAMLPNP